MPKSFIMELLITYPMYSERKAFTKCGQRLVDPNIELTHEIVNVIENNTCRPEPAGVPRLEDGLVTTVARLVGV